MKMTSNGRQPQNIKSGISQQPSYWSWLMNSKGEIRGKLRWSLECGSAKPSLLFNIFEVVFHSQKDVSRLPFEEKN